LGRETKDLLRFFYNFCKINRLVARDIAGQMYFKIA
jgi:hypothetical protein